MQTDSPKRLSRRGFIRWLLILIVVLPTAALLFLNGILATPTACKIAEAKIKNRTQLDASIDRISIWPWAGITIHGLSIDLPKEVPSTSSEPALHIKAIQIDPVWTTLLGDDRQFKSITLDTPRAVIPAELLAAALASTPPAVGPPLATNTTTPPSPGPPTPRPNPPPANPSKPTSPPTQPTSQPRPTAAEKKSAPAPPTRWIHIKNASMLCTSTMIKNLEIKADGIHGSIPVAGKAHASTLKIASAHVNQSPVLTNHTVSLQWLAPRLSMEPITTKLGDLTCNISAQLLITGGIPLEIRATLPQQKLPLIPLPMNGTGEAKNITAKAHFIGLLFSPNTWQGEAALDIQSPTITVKNEDTHFDQGHAMILLRSGQLSCIDARLTSEKASLLGNGTILSDGRMAGNLRVVAHPSITQHIVHEFFPNNKKTIVFTPLSTPQRSAFDLEARGNFKHLIITLGHNGPVIETSLTNVSSP